MRAVAEIKKRLLNIRQIESGDDGFAAVFRRNGTLWNVIAAWDMGWDHVSVSLPGQNRCPRWDEMCFIKELFFADDEWVTQYHPAKKDYVNIHPYTLHLWRPQNEIMPTPPAALV
jgi:hypothetical protein